MFLQKIKVMLRQPQLSLGGAMGIKGGAPPLWPNKIVHQNYKQITPLPEIGGSL